MGNADLRRPDLFLHQVVILLPLWANIVSGLYSGVPEKCYLAVLENFAEY